jgi:hypothetical protein
MDNQPTIDERLQFLLQSTESLHASCQELHASIARQAEVLAEQDKRWNRLNKAIRAAVLAYFEEEKNGDAA